MLENELESKSKYGAIWPSKAARRLLCRRRACQLQIKAVNSADGVIEYHNPVKIYISNTKQLKF